ncbi:MAG TPA: hypothetical protein VFZ32_02685 [Micromonosporaceae bacterium]
MSSTTLLPPAPLVAGGPLGSARELRRDFLGAPTAAHRRYGDLVRFRVGPPGIGREIHALFHPDIVYIIHVRARRHPPLDGIC